MVEGTIKYMEKSIENGKSLTSAEISLYLNAIQFFDFAETAGQNPKKDK